MSELIVQMDNRARLVAAVLAASDWPEHEPPFVAHPFAEATRRYVSDYDGHPAVTLAGEWRRSGRSIEPLFAAALSCDWPLFRPAEALEPPLDAWAQHLADFYVDTAIAAFFWSDHHGVWQTAEAEVKRVLGARPLSPPVAPPNGRPSPPIILTPNLVYPAGRGVAARANDRLYLVVPPPPAAATYEANPEWVAAECNRLLAEIRD